MYVQGKKKGSIEYPEVFAAIKICSPPAPPAIWEEDFRYNDEGELNSAEKTGSYLFS